MTFIRVIIIIVISFYCKVVMADIVPANKLYKYADGLNIEGGIIPSKKLRKNQLWANLAVVLDRPLITGETLKDISNKNTYALKEAYIHSYNEMLVNTAYASIIDYYISNSHKICNKNKKQHTNMTIQIHRDSSARNHLNLLQAILAPKIEEKKLIYIPIKSSSPYHLAYYYYQPNSSLISFKRGFKGDALEQEEDADIIISLSMVAGLNQNHESGTLLIPTTFIPYEVETSNLQIDSKYVANNHLKAALPEILKRQSIKTINHLKSIASENMQKPSHTPRLLTADDFHTACILQANNYFYPKT